MNEGYMPEREGNEQVRSSRSSAPTSERHLELMQGHAREVGAAADKKVAVIARNPLHDHRVSEELRMTLSSHPDASIVRA
ncbi:hypothetical protein [Microbacterium sp. K2]|uniref:hypothetical protein n=1 Tax=Microbacterium sp. K2 TaxID=3391827 RepID=UPI003ED9B241